MELTQNSLVIVDANTSEYKVYWKGQLVPNLGISVSFDNHVTLKVAEDPILAEMVAAGIIIRRV